LISVSPSVFHSSNTITAEIFNFFMQETKETKFEAPKCIIFWTFVVLKYNIFSLHISLIFQLIKNSSSFSSIFKFSNFADIFYNSFESEIIECFIHLCFKLLYVFQNFIFWCLLFLNSYIYSLEYQIHFLKFLNFV
jgi:hypothetical protein